VLSRRCRSPCRGRRRLPGDAGRLLAADVNHSPRNATLLLEEAQSLGQLFVQILYDTAERNRQQPNCQPYLFRCISSEPLPLANAVLHGTPSGYIRLHTAQPSLHAAHRSFTRQHRPLHRRHRYLRRRQRSQDTPKVERSVVGGFLNPWRLIVTYRRFHNGPFSESHFSYDATYVHMALRYLGGFQFRIRVMEGASASTMVSTRNSFPSRSTA
jgi:hypothetical protein